ncbi:MAG TPA: amidohydrolase family protein, partial [Candidatus Binatia bacterium]
MKFLLALLAALALASTSAAQEKVTVLQVDLLIDGTGREPVRDAVVVVEGRRIKAAGRRGEVAVPAGARVIGGKGLVALPGLIDSHA